MTPLRTPSLPVVRAARSPLAKAIVVPVRTATHAEIRIVFILPPCLFQTGPPPVLPRGNNNGMRIFFWISGADCACNLGGKPRGLGRRRADPNPVCLECLLLALGGTGRPGDNRPRMPHRLPRRGREAGDVADDRLRHLGADELGGLLLLVAADLTDQHDELGLVVGLEPGEDVDERRADDGVAADADD